MKQLQTMHDFYTVMNESCCARRRIVAALLADKEISAGDIACMKNFLSLLREVTDTTYRCTLGLEGAKTVALDLTYEITEFEKDIYFLTHSEKEFFAWRYGEMACPADVEAVTAFVRDADLHAFITDRDGTVNNYCGRYASSIQSIYNAVFLSQFIRQRVANAVILTSAPLSNPGLVDISTMPEKTCFYAGSKGREYIGRDGIRRTFPIEEAKQKKLDELNARLGHLVAQPAYEKYTLIGSGLQYKFGQTTIARQDISGSIPEEESRAFREKVEKIVAAIDPATQYFRIEDTGKDIEVILTIADTHTTQKDFDKGDGVEFLNTACGLRLEKGMPLVCGDTASDVPMVSTAQKISNACKAIFVTKDTELQERVRAVTPQALFVAEPDSLVFGLYASAGNH